MMADSPRVFNCCRRNRGPRIEVWIVAQSAVVRTPMILVVVRMTVFHDIAYVAQNEERKGRHALFLFFALPALMSNAGGWARDSRLMLMSAECYTVSRIIKRRDDARPLRSSISCNRGTQTSACHRLSQLAQFPRATFASHSSRIWVAQIDEVAEQVCVYA